MCARCPAAWSADAHGEISKINDGVFSENGDLNLGRGFSCTEACRRARGSWSELCVAAGTGLVGDAVHGHAEGVAGRVSGRGRKAELHASRDQVDIAAGPYSCAAAQRVRTISPFVAMVETSTRPSTLRSLAPC
jgi:hypothetical protein